MLKTTTLFIGLFFGQLTAQAAVYYSVSNWFSNQSATGVWATTQGGPSCNCTPNFSTDTIYINHNITLRTGLNSTTGAIIVENGAKLTVGNWNGSFSIGASSMLHIKQGGELKSFFGFNNASDSVLIDGKLDIVNGNQIINSGSVIVSGTGSFLTKKTWSTHTLNNSGNFTAKAGSTLSIGSINNSGYAFINTELTSPNYSTLTNSGQFIVGTSGVLNYGHVTNETSGQLEVYGEINQQKNWNNFTNNGVVTDNGYIKVGNLTNNNEINGNGIITYNGSNTNNGTVNGCSSCSFVQPTYLAGLPGSGNVKIYRAGAWVNGSPNTNWDAVFLSDFDEDINVECNNVTINASVTVTIKPGKNIVIDDKIHNDGTIIISDKASLVQTQNTANTGSGRFLVQRNTGNLVDDTRFQYWSSPLVSASMGEVFTGSNPVDFYYFDESSQAWASQPANSPMMAGRGYITTGTIGISDASETRTFTGAVNNGTISYQANVTVGENILVGNPYPSAIKCQDFIDDNPGLGGTIYIWDHHTPEVSGTNTTGDYGSWTAMGPISGNSNDKPGDYITLGQGVFVEAISNNPTIIFNNQQRVTGNNSKFFKQTQTDERIRVWLNITNELEDFNQLLVGFIPEATDDYDRSFDGKKFKGHPRISFYSIVDNQDLGIQGLPYPAVGEKKSIPLGVDAWTTGNHTITLDSLYNWPASYSVHLLDELSDTSINLKEATSYTFTVDSIGAIRDRFFLVVTHNLIAIDPILVDNIDNPAVDPIDTDPIPADTTITTGFEDGTAASLDLFASVGAINIQGDTRVDQLDIYDLNGRLVFQQVIGSSTYRLPFDQSGVFVISASLENGEVYTKKVYVP